MPPSGDLADYMWRHGIPQTALGDMFKNKESPVVLALHAPIRAPADVHTLAVYLASVPWFSGAKAADLNALAKVVEYRRIEARAEIISKASNFCCVVLSGAVATDVESAGGAVTLGCLGAGEMIGADQLLMTVLADAEKDMDSDSDSDATDHSGSERAEALRRDRCKASSERRRRRKRERAALPRGSDIFDGDEVSYVAEEACDLVVISRWAFDAHLRRRAYESLCDRFFAFKRLFSDWPTTAVVRLARFARLRSTKQKSVLVAQGSAPPALYLLKKGLCRVDQYVDRRAAVQAKLDSAGRELEDLRLRYTYHYSMRDRKPLARFAELEREMMQLEHLLSVPAERHEARAAETVGALMPPGICGESCLVDPWARAPASIIADTTVEFYEVHTSLFKLFDLAETNRDALVRRARYRDK
ncbi:hypothetical protein M885DRAFT_614589 [Pelagophyceae sp. CCMP2097]|nr:hypothetical protein M885DRAFT_614589 [Pelagophyceae sp. CCMP2097]